jgi:DNA polymerase III alpha subunit (gram-positive type)
MGFFGTVDPAAGAAGGLKDEFSNQEGDREMRDQINVCFRDFRNNPLTFTKVVYTFPNADAELRRRCFARIEEKYGTNPPRQIRDRLEHELFCLSGAEYWDHAAYFLLAATLAEYCDSHAGLHSLRGCAGNSFTAYLLGITEVNPLPPHKYCPACGYVEFVDTAEWESGFDLFGDGQDKEPCPRCGAGLTGDGHSLDSCFLMGDDGGLFPFFDINVSEELFLPMYDYLATLGTIREGLTKAEANTSLYWIAIYGMHWLSALRKLEERTGVPLRDMQIDEILFSAVVENSELLPYISKRAYTLLRQIHPSSFSELVKVFGLAYGTGAWENNAETLIGTTCSRQDVIANRDDILDTLLRYGVKYRTAQKMSHATRKGRARAALTPEMIMLLQEQGVPEWYLSSMRKIEYLGARAHAVEGCIQILRLAWYQVHYPREFTDVIFVEDWGNIM